MKLGLIGPKTLVSIAPSALLAGAGFFASVMDLDSTLGANKGICLSRTPLPRNSSSQRIAFPLAGSYTVTPCGSSADGVRACHPDDLAEVPMP